MMVGFLAILIFSITGLILTKKEKTEIIPVTTMVKIMPTATAKTQGSISLLKVDETTFAVYADSAGLDIVGYDILIDFDSSKADIDSVVSADPNFSIFKTEKPGLLIITGTKKLIVKEPTVFAKTKILTIKGAPVSIVSQSGKEITKFVDSVSKIYHPVISY